MGFFSPSESSYTSETWSGLRGLGKTAQQMADYLVPTIQTGANYGLNLFQNPGGQLNANGLYPQQGNIFSSIVNQLGSKMSAGLGARGALSPLNIPAVAGGAATAAAPVLLPLVTQNIQGIQGMGGNLFASLLGTGTNALGSYSKSTGTAAGPGIGYNWATDLGSNLTKWAQPGAWGKGSGIV